MNSKGKPLKLIDINFRSFFFRVKMVPLLEDMKEQFWPFSLIGITYPHEPLILKFDRAYLIINLALQLFHDE